MVMSVDVETLRRDLEANNGMPGLEILRPEEVDAAVRIFYRDGFVVVRDVLTTDQVKHLRRGCEREADARASMDRNRECNRGRYRYSWGGASITNSVLHREEWVMLVELPTLAPIVTAIFGSSDYHVRRAAGDFCLPGAEYQRLLLGHRRSRGRVHGPTRHRHDPRSPVSGRLLQLPRPGLHEDQRSDPTDTRYAELAGKDTRA